MAVDFYRNFQVLIQDFQRRGLHPEVVATSGGEPPRAVQIRVANALMVHWDADSRSVWAEGPWADVQRLEGYIRRRFSGGAMRKLRRPRVLARVLVLGAMLAILFGVCVPLLRKRPIVLAPVTPPPASETATKEGSTTPTATDETAANRSSAASATAETSESAASEDLPSTRPSPQRSSSGR